MVPRTAVLLNFLLLLAATASAESDRFSVHSATSDIHWRVYSDSFLPFGHNHVISTSRIAGSVRLAPAPQPSQFELLIPASALVVDSPALRQRYGKPFSARMTAKAIAGTRANMLGPALLDAARYPEIRLSGTAVVSESASAQDLVLEATLQLAGRSLRLRLPSRLQIRGGELRATGHFTLSHSQLGLQPFSTAMGALRVAGNIDFTYDIRARRGD